MARPRFTCERYTPQGLRACTRTPRPRTGLGYVEWEAPAQSATLLVGRNKGKRPGNRKGACAKAPDVTPLERPEDAVFVIRAKQVGPGNAGLTRMKARGIYEGAKEDTVAIQVFPSEKDGSWKQFQRNVGKIAETLAAGMCQDEVLVVYDNGDKKQVVSHAWTDREGKIRKPAGDARQVKMLRKR